MSDHITAEEVLAEDAEMQELADGWIRLENRMAANQTDLEKMVADTGIGINPLLLVERRVELMLSMFVGTRTSERLAFENAWQDQMEELLVQLGEEIKRQRLNAAANQAAQRLIVPGRGFPNLNQQR